MSETKPLTEDDLVALERRIDTDWITAYSCTSCGAVNHLPADTRHDHVAMESVGDRLRHLAARRVAGAEEEDSFLRHASGIRA